VRSRARSRRSRSCRCAHRAAPASARDVAASWRGDCAEHIITKTYFTQILPSEDVERAMSVSSLASIGREEAVRLGRKARADRVVWGSIGQTEAKNSFQIFADVVWHKVTYTDHDGNRTTRWVEVPLEVVARTRTVKVNCDYEVISTRGGATLARRAEPRTIMARVVWTSYAPVGNCADYSLVSEEIRNGDPERAKRVEAKWSAVVGAGTTLSQVLDAKRTSSNASTDHRQVLARFAAGAAFVFLEDLPPNEELAMAALQGGWQSVYDDLVAARSGRRRRSRRRDRGERSAVAVHEHTTRTSRPAALAAGRDCLVFGVHDETSLVR
jgi:hypothetical protein